MVQLVPQFLLFFWLPHVPGGCSALPNFAPILWSLLSQNCSSLGSWLWPVSVNPGLYLLLQRFMAWSWFCKGLWLWSTPLEFPGSGGPRPIECLAQTYSLRGPRLMLKPTEVSGSCLFPLMYQSNDWTTEVLAQANTLWGPWLIPWPSEISGSCPLPWRFQIHAQTYRGPS